MSSRLLTMTSFIIILILGSVAVLLNLPSVPGEVRYQTVEMAEDHKSFTVEYGKGDSTRIYTIDEWRSDVKPLWPELFPEPVTIGDIEQPPERFDLFGRATVSPEGDKLFFTTTTYAMATTMSVFGVLLSDTGDLKMMDEAKHGGMEDDVWSPDGRYLVYTLGSARAQGDFLKIDDLERFEQIIYLSQDEIIEALKDEIPDYHSGSGNAGRMFLKPHFRNPEWKSENVLHFTTNKYDQGDETVRWEFNASDGLLKLSD